MRISAVALAILAAASAARTAPAQTLSGASLVDGLRRGGYVLVMRHTSSPRDAPTGAAANADNTQFERQLDANGRATAIAMGKALRDLKIPVGAVISSPTYRALETVRLAQLPNPRTQDELGDGGQSMQAVVEAQTVWLRRAATEFPVGANTILITHLPNISAAFPQWSSDLSDGETLVLGRNEGGAATLIARIKIEQWPTLR
jgi:phosphohistidine phosphatase SixA